VERIVTLQNIEIIEQSPGVVHGLCSDSAPSAHEMVREEAGKEGLHGPDRLPRYTSDVMPDMASLVVNASGVASAQRRTAKPRVPSRTTMRPALTGRCAAPARNARALVARAADPA
jgi:hypothetical protein